LKLYNTVGDVSGRAAIGAPIAGAAAVGVPVAVTGDGDAPVAGSGEADVPSLTRSQGHDDVVPIRHPPVDTVPQDGAYQEFL